MAPTARCAGAKSHVTPGRPLGMCLSCARLHLTGEVILATPQQVDGRWACALRVVPVPPSAADGSFASGLRGSDASSSAGGG
jgi:hypothetical protein